MKKLWLIALTVSLAACGTGQDEATLEEEIPAAEVEAPAAEPEPAPIEEMPADSLVVDTTAPAEAVDTGAPEPTPQM